MFLHPEHVEVVEVNGVRHLKHPFVEQNVLLPQRCVRSSLCITVRRPAVMESRSDAGFLRCQHTWHLLAGYVHMNV